MHYMVNEKIDVHVKKFNSRNLVLQYIYSTSTIFYSKFNSLFAKFYGIFSWVDKSVHWQL